MQIQALKKISTTVRIPLLSIVGATCLTGCSVVSEFTGVEFETVYSPQQKEAFSASFILSMRNIVGENYTLTPEQEKSLFDVAKILCVEIYDNGRDVAKQDLLKQMSELQPEAADSSILSEKYSEVLILASTAQGSFCPDAV
jgi:hypothetical protein